MPRPSKYKPEYCEMLIEHMNNGYSYRSFGGVVGVGLSSMVRWEQAHKEWKESKEIGQNSSLLHFERLAMACTRGMKVKAKDGTEYKPDKTMLIFTLKTRFHEVWGERLDQKVEIDPITITYTKKS